MRIQADQMGRKKHMQSKFATVPEAKGYRRVICTSTRPIERSSFPKPASNMYADRKETPAKRSLCAVNTRHPKTGITSCEVTEIRKVWRMNEKCHDLTGKET